MQKIVLIGDSIRLGYQGAVARALLHEAVVAAPEENCQSSVEVRANAREWITAANPDIVHLNCGLHDLRMDAGDSTHRVPIDAYAENLEAIFNLVASSGSRKLIWATTTPLIEDRHQRSRLSRRYEADVARYNEIGLTIARKYSAAVNDLHAAVLHAGAGRLLGPDGVHFTEDGSALLAQAVVNAVRSVLRGGNQPPRW
nr:SGNH/GDSL hydrolase family protein [uncultured Albidiferax sp.]